MNSLRSQFNFAGENVTEGLFKFRSYREAEDIDRVKNILGGRLYFSTCDQMNDPFEMRVLLSPHSNPRSRLKGVLKAAADVPAIRNLAPAKRLQKASQLSNKLASNPRLLRDAARGHYARMTKECFVFCMSATRSHPLLWSHYADKHTGICIQFDHKKVPFSGATKVEYSARYPIATYPFHEDLAELTQKGILTKAQYWHYEEEYRLFSVRIDNPSWHLGLNWPDEHTAEVSAGLITGITLGAKMPEKAKQELMKYCRENHPDIIIEQAEICEDRFAMSFREVETINVASL